MISELPKTFLNKESLGSLQYIFVWFFIAMWTFVDPGFYQRIIASGSTLTSKVNSANVKLGFRNKSLFSLANL